MAFIPHIQVGKGFGKSVRSQILEHANLRGTVKIKCIEQAVFVQGPN